MTDEEVERLARIGYECMVARMSAGMRHFIKGWQQEEKACREDWRAVVRAILTAQRQDGGEDTR